MGSCVSSSAHTTTAPHSGGKELSKNEIGMSESANAPFANVRHSFVQLRNSSLWLGSSPFRFASLNSPELLDGDVNAEFEVEDTMQSIAMGFGRAVTRTYTLRIKSGRVARGHINGWNASWGDWEWDEGRLVEFDFVLDSARRHGVKLIIPIINQDFGDESTNWVGNTRNLIAMKKGISLEEAKSVDWWIDHEMIESFKLIIDKLLNRRNTFNGMCYKDDPTILAWETGNEMNYLGYRPAPASWTLTVARHLKHLAPNTLVMDGSFARTSTVSDCYPQAVLESKDIDMFSFHYYGSGDIARVKTDCAFVKKYGKAFIAGEVGFFDDASEYSTFLSSLAKAGGAGSLIWSLRPHSSTGGFKTHSEGNGHFSYHVPGSSTPQHSEFDRREADIVSTIRKHSYQINSEKVPHFPTPPPPSQLWLEGSTLRWRGAAWAKCYEMIIKDLGTGREIKFDVDDFTKEGIAGFDLVREMQGARDGKSVRLRGVGNDGGVGADSVELFF